MKAVCYLLAKFTKLTVLNLTILGPWEAGCIVKILLRYCIVKKILILYHIVNILKVPIPSKMGSLASL